MRLRRISLKILLVLATLALLTLLFIIYFNRSDEFITFLPTINDADTPAQARIPQEVEAEDDTRILLNLTNFKYIIKNNVCKEYERELLGIIIVTSYVSHDELRAAHRQAIPQRKLTEMGLKRIFLLAAIPHKERFITQSQLESEQHRFGDLLQGNFQENYRNLSYKHIMGLRWASTECKNAKFILKIDDDIVYDIFQIRRYLESLEIENKQLTLSNEFLAGYIIDNKFPVRNSASKWYVSKEEYSKNTYPSYLSGWLYFTNNNTAIRLVRAAAMERNRIFWIDDTWVLGILRESLRIKMQPLNPWYSANAEFLDCCVRDLYKFNYECEYFIGPNGGDSNLLVEFLHNVEKCYFDECIKRPAAAKSLKETCVGKVKHIIPPHGEGSVQQLKVR